MSIHKRTIDIDLMRMNGEVNRKMIELKDGKVRNGMKFLIFWAELQNRKMSRMRIGQRENIIFNVKRLK